MWVVYTHREEDGAVVYIGAGRADRPYSLNRSDNPEHLSWMIKKYDNGVEFVSIHSRHTRRRDAFQTEAKLLKQRHPQFNLKAYHADAKERARLAALQEQRSAVAKAWADNIRPTILTLCSSGYDTLQCLADELNRRGLTAPRGGPWRPSTVQRVLGKRQKWSEA